jgi:hypothetical protein
MARWLDSARLLFWIRKFIEPLRLGSVAERAAFVMKGSSKKTVVVARPSSIDYVMPIAFRRSVAEQAQSSRFSKCDAKPAPQTFSSHTLLRAISRSLPLIRGGLPAQSVNIRLSPVPAARRVYRCACRASKCGRSLCIGESRGSNAT